MGAAERSAERICLKDVHAVVRPQVVQWHDTTLPVAHRRDPSAVLKVDVPPFCRLLSSEAVRTHHFEELLASAAPVAILGFSRQSIRPLLTTQGKFPSGPPI